jgi:hypothetical protein
MPDIKEEQAEKLVSDWYFAAYNRNAKRETLDDYQRGVADTYEIVSKALKDQLKKNKEVEYQKRLNEVLDNHGRYYHVEGFIAGLSAILIPVIIFFVGTGLFSQNKYVLPFAYLLFLTIAAARYWQARKSIDTSIIFICVGIVLIAVSMLGISPLIAVTNSMTTAGGQVMGAALAAGLVLQIRKRKSWKDIALAAAVFSIGLCTIMYYSGPILTTLKSLPGILGFELLGAGITVLFIGGWMEQ